jgi:hypothetical protein
MQSLYNVCRIEADIKAFTSLITYEFLEIELDLNTDVRLASSIIVLFSCYLFDVASFYLYKILTVYSISSTG